MVAVDGAAGVRRRFGAEADHATLAKMFAVLAA